MGCWEKFVLMVESLFFIGAGACEKNTREGAGQKRTDSATMIIPVIKVEKFFKYNTFFIFIFVFLQQYFLPIFVNISELMVLST